MTDDKRIERLTELTRRVPEWSSLPDLRIYADGRGQASVTYADPPVSRQRLVTFEAHPRSFDALEAALTVLAQDEDGADGSSAKPTTLKACWDVIEMMDIEVKGAMGDLSEERAEHRATCTMARELREQLDRAREWRMRAQDRPDLVELDAILREGP